MPVKSAVLKHCIALISDFFTNDQDHGNSQKHHADNDMQTVQTGYGVIESEENVEARLGIEQQIRIGIEVVMKLGAPLEVFVDQKRQAAQQ